MPDRDRCTAHHRVETLGKFTVRCDRKSGHRGAHRHRSLEGLTARWTHGLRWLTQHAEDRAKEAKR